MYSCILVVLDGSISAERALSWVRPLARRSPVRVHLLMICPPPKPAADNGRVVALADQIDESVRAPALAYLERVAADLRADGVTVLTQTRAGEAGAIRVAAIEVGADLVAVAPTQSQALRRLLALGRCPRILPEAPAPVATSIELRNQPGCPGTIGGVLGAEVSA